MRKAGRKRILVVEDDAHVARLLELLLQPLDADVERAADGASAVASASARPPDLILADFQLPDMTGLEAVRRLRERGPDPPIPVVVLTGHPNPENIKEAVDLGVVDFLTKPDALSAKGVRRIRRILGLPEPAPAKPRKAPRRK
jgi:two-component system OmpR family response regulator